MDPVVSLLQRFHRTGQLTVVPVVSLLQRFHCIYVCMYKPLQLERSRISAGQPLCRTEQTTHDCL